MSKFAEVGDRGVTAALWDVVGDQEMRAGFTLDRIDVGGVVLRVRYGGAGPPVLLLHGHTRTHVTWHRVAPLLAGAHSVVCPDLRGYGESSKPATTADHAPYSKRRWLVIACRRCARWGMIISPWPGTTAAAMSRSVLRWTIQRQSPIWRCWMASRLVRR
jgi:hypothetical protein